jgi:hypothetical protein
MEAQSEAGLLRIFISNTDKFKHATRCEMLVFVAKHKHCHLLTRNNK